MKPILYLTLSIVNNEKFIGAARAARRLGLVLQAVEDDNAHKPSLKTLIDFWQPLGIIIDGSGRTNVSDKGVRERIPVVHLDCPPLDRTCRQNRVCSDSRAFAQAAARELLSLNYPHFAFAGYPKPRYWSEERHASFAAALKMNGRRLDSSRDFDFDQNTTDAHKALRTWLRQLPRPCAVYAANDRLAEHISVAVRDIGAKIPEDIALIGTDNLTARCENALPPISSISPDFEQAGALAAEMIHELLHNATAKPRIAMFGYRAVVRRESTRPLLHHQAKVSKALKMIREHALCGLRAGQVLDAMGDSRRLAEMHFKKAVGHSVIDEIISVRIEHAKRLLEDPDRKISETAALCGYLSVNAFRRVFAEATGLTPLQYRQSLTRAPKGHTWSAQGSYLNDTV